MTHRGKWTASDMPTMDGKAVVVTGANSGIGFCAARELARRGAHVVMACRSLDKGRAAMMDVRESTDNGQVELLQLDLADLASVRAFAEDLRGRLPSLDVLCNNAGVMAIPRRTTADGFEMQLGTNHLGHFALTGRLMGLLEVAEAPRVVNVSSMAHRFGAIRFDDLQSESSNYDKWRAYGQSKLANLLFTYELQRRSSRNDLRTIAVACHPGYSSTNLQLVGPKMEGATLMEKLSSAANTLVAQSAEMGALPTLYAASSAEVRGGDYIGPDGFMEARGYPTKVESNAASHDAEVARRLWERSEELTGVTFGLP